MIDYWMPLCRGQRTCGVGARVHGRRLTARHHLRVRTVHTLLDLDIQPLMPADVRDVDDRGGQTGACQKFPNPIQIRSKLARSIREKASLHANKISLPTASAMATAGT